MQLATGIGAGLLPHAALGWVVACRMWRMWDAPSSHPSAYRQTWQVKGPNFKAAVVASFYLFMMKTGQFQNKDNSRPLAKSVHLTFMNQKCYERGVNSRSGKEGIIHQGETAAIST
jgi:hypothetical protein